MLELNLQPTELAVLAELLNDGVAHAELELKDHENESLDSDRELEVMKMVLEAKKIVRAGVIEKLTAEIQILLLDEAVLEVVPHFIEVTLLQIQGRLTNKNFHAEWPQVQESVHRLVVRKKLRRQAGGPSITYTRINEG